MPRASDQIGVFGVLGVSAVRRAESGRASDSLCDGAEIDPSNPRNPYSAVRPDPHRLALEQALAEVRAARAPLDAAETRLLALLSRDEPGVPLSTAARELNVTDEALYKRHRRGTAPSYEVAGRIYFPQSYVAAMRAANLSRQMSNRVQSQGR